MISKKILVPVFAVAIAGGTFFGVNQFAHAQTNTGQTLVQMIAQTFGLDQTKVQAVFDNYKQQHQATFQQNMQNRLKAHFDTLVKQGKITQAQEDAILSELAKLRSEYNPTTLKSKTPQERQQAFQQEQNELNTWAQSQGIDSSLLKPMGGMRMHGRFWHTKQSPTVTPTP